jgi:hypothetical protein
MQNLDVKKKKERKKDTSIKQGVTVWEWEPVRGERVKGQGEGEVDMIEVLHKHI